MFAAATRKNSSDEALAAIQEAHTLIGQVDQAPRQLEEPSKAINRTRYLADASVLKQVKKSPHTRFMLRSLAGLLALAGVGIAVLAWPLNRGQVAPEPTSTSSMSMTKKHEMLTLSAPPVSQSPAATFAGPPDSHLQASPQGEPFAPVVAPMVPELANQIQEIARELANLERGVDRLTTEQSKMARENAELAEQLKAMREPVRHNAELSEDVKEMQRKMTGEISNLADQLKANQDLMATLAGQLKEGQEKVARLAEQRPRPKTVSSSPTVANSARRPAPKPPTTAVGDRAQDPRPLEPKQQ